MSIDVRAHTALHIVKGAIYKVLNAQWSTSASTNGSHGRITVELNRKPTNQEITEIKRLINKKIEENQTIETYTMNRKEAEERWGDLIYDKFPIPAHITELKIFHLPEWNINTCNKEHTKTTGQIGEITITKTRYRNSKQVFEVSFNVKE